MQPMERTETLIFPSRAQIVRAIGNTLNASTYRGNAHGFQLEALMKVSF